MEQDGKMLSYGGFILDESSVIATLIDDIRQICENNPNFNFKVFDKNITAENLLDRLAVSPEFGSWERGTIIQFIGNSFGNTSFYSDIYSAVGDYFDDHDRDEDYDEEDEEDYDDDDEDDEEPSF